MDWLHSDVRPALREFRRRPWLTAIMVGTLAVGLGVNAVAFSAVDALFFSIHRLPNARALGWLFIGTRGNTLAGSTTDTFRAVQSGARTLEGLAAEGRLPVAIVRDGTAELRFGGPAALGRGPPRPAIADPARARSRPRHRGAARRGGRLRGPAAR